MTNPATPEIPDGLEKRLRDRAARFRADKIYPDIVELDDQAADALAKASVALRPFVTLLEAYEKTDPAFASVSDDYVIDGVNHDFGVDTVINVGNLRNARALLDRIDGGSS